ncbi:MAG TPA: hypothetical protein VGM81_12085 [Burkholderiaceae bacterium]
MLCVTAVVVLHAALLLHTTRDTRHFTSGAVMNVRSLDPSEPAPVQTLAPPETAAALPQPSLQPLPRSDFTLPESAPSHADAPAPELRYPDAPLPGGEARAKVSLVVGIDGFVDTVVVTPNALPTAFENAVKNSFVGSKLSAEQLGGQFRTGRFCIEVHFRESTPPEWRRVDAGGICAG